MTVTSFAPGQVVKVEPNPEVSFAKFTALVFHPDLLSRTALGRQMNRYEFFSYSSTEALHLSAQEVEVFRGVLAMIEQELHRAIDKHTRELIVSNIELLLNYCLRFYDRQFITREEINHSVVRKFMALLDDYISTKALREGLPTVAYFAGQCCLSNGYFGNLVRVETGRTAKDIISDHLLAHAKQLLNDEELTITMISQRLGFEYTQHFVRFFKTHTGKTPSTYRNVAGGLGLKHIGQISRSLLKDREIWGVALSMAQKRRFAASTRFLGKPEFFGGTLPVRKTKNIGLLEGKVPMFCLESTEV